MRQLDMLAANFWALKGKDLQELRHLLLHLFSSSSKCSRLPGMRRA